VSRDLSYLKMRSDATGQPGTGMHSSQQFLQPISEHGVDYPKSLGDQFNSADVLLAHTP